MNSVLEWLLIPILLPFAIVIRATFWLVDIITNILHKLYYFVYNEYPD